MLQDLINRYSMDRTIYNQMKALNVEESQELQRVISDTYNAHGELSVIKYIESTRYLDELMVDEINPGEIKTVILNDPYRISIFLPEYPPRLKQYGKTKFSTNLGYGHVAGRWHGYMGVALNELRQKGIITFIEPVVIYYKFHFRKPGMDVDNYAIKFINDTFRYARIIRDDSFDRVSVFTKGTLDLEMPGTEITILAEIDFYNNLAAII